MADTVVAEALGSMSVMCRADVPAARSLSVGKATKESKECEVDLVSTHVEVGRSHVLSEWSQDVEYATV